MSKDLARRFKAHAAHGERSVSQFLRLLILRELEGDRH
jgi:hypothetical protein